MKLTLKDGSVKEYQNPITAAEAAKDLSMGLYRAACAARIDGKVADLRTVLDHDCTLEILTFADEEGQRAFNHTASHILAQAVTHLYPEAKFAIGPAIDNGFYYDFDLPTPFTTEDLEKLEKEMAAIVKADLPLEKFELDAPEALEQMKDQPYKVELIQEHAGKGEKISFYRQGDFTDLCAGPHLMTTAPVKAIKLTSSTGAYWRGSEKNKMLCRVYGTAFPKRSELEAYLARIEEAKRRDHRKLGKELGLFMLTDEGPGFPFFLPKGMVLKNTLIDYWREVHKKYGYVEIATPIILNRSLWERSGHWDHYKQNMYTTVIDEEDYAVKPMNCPGGMLVYASEPHSYRDLPLRVGELGLVHRHELSGALHGLFRVRCFTQDDAHVFMTREQMKEIIQETVRLFDEVYSVFGLEYEIELSTMPEDHIGTAEAGLPPGRFPGPDLAVRHHPAGQPAAGAVPAGIHRGRRRKAPPCDDPPGGAGLHRAVYRGHHRALCRGLPLVALPGAGGGAAYLRKICGLRPEGGGGAGCRRPAVRNRPAPGKGGVQNPPGPAAKGPLYAGGG